MENLKPLQRLIDSLSKLPSIGTKSAERLAYAMLDMDDDDLDEFSDAVHELKRSIKKCQVCGNYSLDDMCPICLDADRDKETLMVVSYPKDIISIEKSEGYNGLYHVLGGVISASKGKGIEDLDIDGLLDRVEQGNFKEVILATNPNVDGEVTALYIAKKLQNKNIKITRLAYGLQMGGALDYVDALTLSRALEGRTKI